jgi:glutathione S-transferase
MLGGMVMDARKKFDVKIPNLYATPGFHKQADDFNRVQRGHQSMFETLSSFTALALLGGIKHPITTAVAGLLFCVGNYFYLLGYSDTSLAVETARYKKGGMLKVLGFLTAFGTCISFAGSVIGWF